MGLAVIVVLSYIFASTASVMVGGGEFRGIMEEHMDLRRTVVTAVVLLVALAGLPACKDSSTENAGTLSLPHESILVNHLSTRLATIPDLYLAKAKRELRIAYGHTSHGSQLVDGMQGLAILRGVKYAVNETGADSALILHDTPFAGASDLGNPDFTSWASATRTYLDSHTNINVVIWSWCGQVSSASAADIDTYLSLMNDLEKSFPNVHFVYMTGHLDGTGLKGNLHVRNEQIRAYCKDNKKALYDFEDIESYNPGGTYFGDKSPTDNCDYDSDGNGSTDKNWARDWQDAHPGEWYTCGAAHTLPVNANQKAYAAWWLWARLVGWNGQ
jgi:hypothetical protein